MIDLDDLPNPDALSDDELLSVLGEVQSLIDAGRAAESYRVDLFRSARARNPAIPHTRLSAVAGISGSAIVQAINKADARKARSA